MDKLESFRTRKLRAALIEDAALLAEARTIIRSLVSWGTVESSDSTYACLECGGDITDYANMQHEEVCDFGRAVAFLYKTKYAPLQ